MIKSKKLLVLLAGITLSTQIFAKNITVNENEVRVYAAQKLKVDFNAQTNKSKKDIINEYAKSVELADKLLSKSMKNDINYKVASKQLVIDIWAQKFIQTAKVSDKELKELFKKLSPKVSATYKLSNILVKSEKKANSLIKKLSKISNEKKRLKEFKKLVKKESYDSASVRNNGQLGWIDVNKLDNSIKEALKKAKKNLLKVEAKNIGWQVILIEDSKKEQKASFEEAKDRLTLIAKRDLLKKEIEKILK